MPGPSDRDEAGLKGFEVGAWHGIYAPKGTPDEIIQKAVQDAAGSVA
jgi:tripartite-type tricarboxylate transporter receptor subunit TctC